MWSVHSQLLSMRSRFLRHFFCSGACRIMRNCADEHVTIFWTGDHAGGHARSTLGVDLYLLFWFLVHCRRRKIRCLVAPDDSQGRCENCIRLRKECQFFPVDQQPPVEKKSRPTSRLETQPPADHSTSITSSPTNVKFDSAEPFYPYPQIPLNASSGQDIPAFNPAVYAGHPMSGFTPGRLALTVVGFGLLRQLNCAAQRKPVEQKKHIQIINGHLQ